MNLSIIIPHFNGSNFLSKLLSTIPQNQEIQIIVVDDKSEVFHLKSILELQNQYNFEFHQNNKIKGAGSCRNIGLEKARGKWILFADSDDYFVENFYDKIRKYFHSNNDVIFFTPTSRYINTNKIADRHNTFQKKISEFIESPSRKNELFLRYTYVVSWSRMIRREFIETHKIKFDEIKIAEDVMFATKIGHLMKDFEVSKEIIYCIVKRSGSFSKLNIKEDVFDVWANIKILYLKFLNDNIPKTELATIMKPYICNKAAELLLRSLKRFRFKKSIKIYSLYKKENIQWFRLAYLNPLKIMRYVFIIINNNLKN